MSDLYYVLLYLIVALVLLILSGRESLYINVIDRILIPLGISESIAKGFARFLIQLTLFIVFVFALLSLGYLLN